MLNTLIVDENNNVWQEPEYKCMSIEIPHKTNFVLKNDPISGSTLSFVLI